MNMPPDQVADGTRRTGPETAKAPPEDLREDAEANARELSETVARETRDRTDRAKKGVADGISSVSPALRCASDDLREGSPQDRSFGAAASALADLSDTICDKDIGQMGDEMGDFARRNPMAFLGGAALPGFAGARMAKASQRTRLADDTRTGGMATNHVTPFPHDTPPHGNLSRPGHRNRHESRRGPDRPEPNRRAPMTHFPNESTTGLIGDAMTHVSALLRGEVNLAPAEIDRNLRRAGTAIGMLAAALVVSLTALNVLTGAIVAGLSEAGMGPGWAAFAVGVLMALVAYGFARKGMNDLKLSSITPSRTAANMRRDAQALKATADSR